MYTSTHFACPFGAKSSVYAWERVGRALCFLARTVLHLNIFRYVDDYFGAEGNETLQHGMDCFARLCRALLGESSIAGRKLECGSKLQILGIIVNPSIEGYTCQVAPAKAAAWIDVLKHALSSGMLMSGCAQKMSGRLQWATQFLFHKLGRGMLQPIYAQIRSRYGHYSARVVA